MWSQCHNRRPTSVQASPHIRQMLIYSFGLRTRHLSHRRWEAVNLLSINLEMQLNETFTALEINIPQGGVSEGLWPCPSQHHQQRMTLKTRRIIIVTLLSSWLSRSSETHLAMHMVFLLFCFTFSGLDFIFSIYYDSIAKVLLSSI